MTRYSQSRGFIYTEPPTSDGDRAADEKESTRTEEEADEEESDEGLTVVGSSSSLAVPSDD